MVRLPRPDWTAFQSKMDAALTGKKTRSKGQRGATRVTYPSGVTQIEEAPGRLWLVQWTEKPRRLRGGKSIHQGWNLRCTEPAGFVARATPPPIANKHAYRYLHTRTAAVGCTNPVSRGTCGPKRKKTASAIRSQEPQTYRAPSGGSEEPLRVRPHLTRHTTAKSRTRSPTPSRRHRIPGPVRRVRTRATRGTAPLPRHRRQTRERSSVRRRRSTRSQRRCGTGAALAARSSRAAARGRGRLRPPASHHCRTTR